MSITRDAVEAFLFHEADLLDELRIEDWLALWTPECCYWVPCNDRDADSTDPERQVSIIYDDRARLEDRVYRLMSSAAHSQRPRSRMRRVVGNLRFELREGEVHTRSNFVLAELRRREGLSGLQEFARRQVCGVMIGLSPGCGLPPDAMSDKSAGPSMTASGTVDR